MIVVVSSENEIENEGRLVNDLFDCGLELFHVRKPLYTFMEQVQFLKQIHPSNYSRLVLHYYHEMAEQFEIHRLHFPEVKRIDRVKKSGSDHIIYSTSVHDIQTFNAIHQDYDYVFFGPVFDSISKEGYKKIPEINIEKDTLSKKIVAIGGIQASNIKNLKDIGYGGAALLGFIWKSPGNATENFKLCKEIWNNQDL